MGRPLQDDWQKEKREFLNNLSRLPFASTSRPSGSPSGTTPQIGWRPSSASLPRQSQEVQGQELVPHTLLDKKAAVYAETTARLNAARERSLPFKVLHNLLGGFFAV